jgi:hypothetical protein
MHRHALSAALAALSLAACGDDSPTSAPADTSGSATCKTDADCASIAVVACRAAVCGEGGICASEPLADGSACTTGNACLEGETCTAGVCAGGTTKAADCGDAECGEDACGNACGACEGSETCEAGACVAGPEACGDVTFEGCCTADGKAKYCNDGALETVDCAADGSPCGWTGEDGYYCGDSGGSDASGEFPWLCPGETCGETCGDRECGFVCGQACGTGCGDGERCSAEGTCESHPCGGVSFLGCCNADGSVTFCENDELVTVDCAAEYPRSPSCGWVSDDYGYFCNFAETADASGDNPYLCGGETCAETCDTRACGSACGQTCAGTCAAGEACDEPNGTCVPDPCGSLTEQGCCDGDTLYWCTGITVYKTPCAGDGTDKCGWAQAEDGSGGGYYCTDSAADDASLPRACDGYGFDRAVAISPDD